jgi:hypothetical protein
MAASPMQALENSPWRFEWWGVVWDASTIRGLIAELITRLAKRDFAISAEVHFHVLLGSFHPSPRCSPTCHGFYGALSLVNNGLHNFQLQQINTSAAFTF